MSKLNPTDIQGFVLRGYNLPYARYCFLHLGAPKAARSLIESLLGVITTGQLWDGGKPSSTVNLAFTFAGLAALDLPLATLVSFPVEFQQGMKARADILGDTGINAPEHWDDLWLQDQPESQVHAWLAINASSPQALESQFAAILSLLHSTGGARLLASQDASALFENGQQTPKEHFGYTDGFGNPDYVDICRTTQPGQGKILTPPSNSSPATWTPLATGELLLGYADEAGELPVAPIPHLMAANGTFMVYRKLHQNVGSFRRSLNEWGAKYGAGDSFAREKLASKFIGRWRDGTPIESSPDAPNPKIVADKEKNVDFTFSADASGSRCPIGAHIRRVHPRDAFGFEGRLINRRRITRRGLPYGPQAPKEDPAAPESSEAAEALDRQDRGIVFMALNASLSRQFEFVQQQWINYGNDAHLGNDKDLLLGNHEPGEKYVIQGDSTPGNPPMICTHLPNFVQLRGGAYFFLPSITALAMIARDLVDPR
jgi:Dyp-type peroxidase family